MDKDISFKFHFGIFCQRVYDVNRISEVLGLQPYKSAVKDETHKLPLYRDYSFWHYESEEQFAYSSDELFDEFLKPLKEKKELIVQLLEEDGLECDFDIIVYIHSGRSTPGCIITAEQAALLAAFKCGVEFDIYDYRKLAGQEEEE